METNGAIRNVIELTRLPLIQEDRLQLQQEVRDSGPGLSSESPPTAFGPFYATKPKGMGMGLSIRGSIIEAHGGRLWATGQPRRALLRSPRTELWP